MKCRECLKMFWGDAGHPDVKKLTAYDKAIGDGLCEQHRLSKQVREAKRAFYGEEEGQ